MNEPSALDLGAAQQLLETFRQTVQPALLDRANPDRDDEPPPRPDLNLEQAQRLLQEFKKLDFPKDKRKTFLQIMDRQGREVMNSRLLQFFLDTSADHGLGDLVLQALCELMNLSKLPVRKTRAVQLEVACKQVAQAGRMDLVLELHSGERIVIENKIHHVANNPFDSYVQHCTQEWPGEEVHFVLLGLNRPEALHEKFVFVSHFELATRIRQQLVDHLGHADHYYLTFLIDYLNTVDAMNPNSRSGKMEAAIVKFYQDNKDTLQALIEGLEVVRQHYIEELTEVRQMLNDHGLADIDFSEGVWEDANKRIFSGAYVDLFSKSKMDEKFTIIPYLFANLFEYGLGLGVRNDAKTGRGKNDTYQPALEFCQKHGFELIDSQETSECYLLKKSGQPTPEQFAAEVLPILKKLEAIMAQAGAEPA